MVMRYSYIQKSLQEQALFEYDAGIELLFRLVIYISNISSNIDNKISKHIYRLNKAVSN